ncbi:uncharacterized protein LOC132304936 [Cornus florida]|uniref:uncharacterized protein LOC132304936 n=1 Tax=Cornus florida TaxID=4283 RepID=UPI00289EC75E|nr:uncharacterized protein LOC132304936 [Cornus florida]
MVNGSPLGFFQPSRGIQQGCPLSPLLFTLITEYLSSWFEAECREGNLVIAPAARKANCLVTHQFFADDLLVVVRANMASVFTLRRMMKHFEEVSGLAVNTDKSEVFFTRSVKRKSNVLRISGCTQGSLPFTYLGLRISNKGLKRLDCKPLMDKVMSTTTRWAVVNLIEIRMRNFDWGHDDNNLKLDSLCWKRVASPKTEGGFGLRQILDIDKAAKCSLVWDFLLSKDRLWVAWFKQCNLRDASYWSVIPKLTHSTNRKSIVAIREILRENFSYHIGNGALIQTFLDPWCRGQFLSEVFSFRTLQQVSHNKQIELGRFIIQAQWQVVGIPLQVKQFMQQFRIYGGADQILWKHKPFTFKDAWDACRESNPEVS